MDLNELIETYDDANLGPLVLSAGNTGRVELADDEDADFAEYESREHAACAVALHNAFPDLVKELRRARINRADLLELSEMVGDVNRLIAVARSLLKEARKGSFSVDRLGELSAALAPFKEEFGSPDPLSVSVLDSIARALRP